jgi:cytochrome P450
MMSFDEHRVDEFVEWVRGVLEIGLTNPEVRLANRKKLMEYLFAEVEDRMEHPRDDFISFLCDVDHEGEKLPFKHIVGTCNLMMVAGIDTTWSSIGSALWHLASHDDDRRCLVADPELLPTAIEELLRAYSPVTMGRIVTEEVEVAGVTMHPGDRVLMNFPGANHDPEVFDRPDEVVLDRERNRHVAFGVGIHRCAGSNLARMEMNVAVGRFLERIPEFRLDDPAAVTWAGGQVRGPRRLPIRIG